MNLPVSSSTKNAYVYDRADLWKNETVGHIRKDLLRFAHSQVRNRETAEDIVQDTLAAALAASDRFEDRAALKTWLFKILKNRIIDLLRGGWHKKRVALQEAFEDDASFSSLFKANESWKFEDMPSHWGDPERSLENQQFWLVFETCLADMPEATARVFGMREILGMEVSEICQELGISQSNCWVILHRARMLLRASLQEQWYGGVVQGK